ncbi:uncharacterized protein KIAA1958-like [Ptychodera flava]|uniref:uncharacterized protein KIAA1958-like n=1 Tax=Ptychodera flava TaxID=63121 RepID=UPI003969CF19
MADNTVADDHDGEMIEWLMSLGADKLDELLGPVPEDSVPDEVDDFIRAHQKESTVKSTERDVRRCTEWLAQNCSETRRLECIEPTKLNELLSKFFISIRKMDGTEYEPSTLTNMKCSLERYLRSKNYSASLNDRVFHKLNQAIRAKQVDLKGQGKGRKELKSEEISAEEEETMWQAGVLGINNPQSANFTMFFLFGKHFGMRGRNEHRQLKFGDIVTAAIPKALNI